MAYANSPVALTISTTVLSSVTWVKVRKRQTTAMLQDRFDGFDKIMELRFEYFKIHFLPVNCDWPSLSSQESISVS